MRDSPALTRLRIEEAQQRLRDVEALLASVRESLDYVIEAVASMGGGK